jgi:hypothetical protein
VNLGRGEVASWSMREGRFVRFLWLVTLVLVLQVYADFLYVVIRYLSSLCRFLVPKVYGSWSYRVALLRSCGRLIRVGVGKITYFGNGQSEFYQA